MNKKIIEIIQKTENNQKLTITGGFLDGHGAAADIRLLANRLLKAALGQEPTKKNFIARYGIWANTVKSNIDGALQLLEKDPDEAKRLLIICANSLAAFSKIQEYYHNISHANIFDYSDPVNGISEVRINLYKLFEEDHEQLNNFYKRFSVFLDSDVYNKKVYITNTVDKIRENNHYLEYKTEAIHPKIQTSKLKVLFLLGNPASHSVSQGIFFAHKFNKPDKEHDFWKVLKELEIIDLGQTVNCPQGNLKHIQNIKNQLFEMEYRSPFQIWLDVFISLPSGAKEGVVKISKLFNQEAFKKIICFETERIKSIIERCDAVIIFQKHTYEALRTEDSPSYNWEKVKREGIVAKTFGEKPLYYCPPTPMMSWPKTRSILLKYKNMILDKK